MKKFTFIFITVHIVTQMLFDTFVPAVPEPWSIFWIWVNVINRFFLVLVVVPCGMYTLYQSIKDYIK
jgi:hypothetical protein